MTEYLDADGLEYYDSKLDKELSDKYQKKEYKTGSESEYKVLSDNNLSDELLDELRNGSDYSKAKNKPAIDGVELTKDSTAEGLGLAKKTDLPGDMTSNTKGIGRPDGTTITVSGGVFKAELGAYATNDSVTSKIDSAKKELEQAIDAKVSSTMTPAGSVTFKELPEPAAGNVGNMYNVTDQFITDNRFKEGSGHSYPPGTNVAVVKDGGSYKLDAMSGYYDFSNFVTKEEITPISNAFIDGLF